MVLPMFRPLCKCINKYLSDVRGTTRVVLAMCKVCLS
jgi:hypothetical protein